MERVISIESLEKTAKSLERRATNQRMVRVPSRLHHSHPEAYTPQFVTIGPFHYIGSQFNHSKDHANLLPMEAQKRVFMLRLLDRTICKEETLQLCWDFVQTETPIAIRSCYPEETDITSNDEDLAKIMLVDGCFLLEVFLWSYEGSFFDVSEDDNNVMASMTLGLRRDLALLENQIPFFVLQDLYNIISPRLKWLKTSTSLQEQVPMDLTHMAIHFFRLPNQQVLPQGHLHLLDLISKCHLPIAHRINFLTNRCYRYYQFDQELTQKHSNKLPLSRGVILHTATKLKDVGVIFRRANTTAILDIQFRNGVLEIPSLVINDCVESKLRNLLAFEYSSKHGMEYYVSYVIFMDRLIGSKEDLQLLERKGIIVNELGGREDATKIFHHISKHFVQRNFYFRHLCHEIDKFCNSPRQRYTQELKQRYFNGPWAALSLVAATILLILTAIQTVYSVLSYYHQGY